MLRRGAVGRAPGRARDRARLGGGIGLAGARHDDAAAELVARARRLGAGRDVLEAERGAERPGERLGAALVGAAAREVEDGRGRGEEEAGRRRGRDRRDGAAERGAVAALEGHDRLVLPLLHGVEEHALDGAADRVEHVGDLLGDLDAEDGVGLREREEALVVVADALGGREEEVDRAERDVDDEDDAADVDAEVDELVEGRLRGAAKVRGREHESRAFEDRAPS